jgi:hypothetical protein
LWDLDEVVHEPETVDSTYVRVLGSLLDRLEDFFSVAVVGEVRMLYAELDHIDTIFWILNIKWSEYKFQSMRKKGDESRRECSARS